MKAMCLNEKAEFVWTDVPDPACHNEFDVKIRIRACAPNRADLMQRAGIYAPPEGWPLWPGLECAGDVIECSGNGRFKIGCKVVALALIAVGMLVTDVRVSVPVFTGTALQLEAVPLTAPVLALCGLCTSVMWSSIFALSVEGLGDATAAASGWFMTMVVGGGIIPLFQNFIADRAGFLVSCAVPACVFAYLILYSLKLSKAR